MILPAHTQSRRKRLGAFGVGFGVTLALLVVVQLLAAHHMSDCGLRAVLALWNFATSGCADDMVRVGFPQMVIERGGFDGREHFSMQALLFDLLLTVGISGGGGRLLARWPRSDHHP